MKKDEPFKNKKPDFTPNSPPIHLSTASVTREKMEAIANLAEATLELAKALNSVNSTITISNVNISATGSSDGIHIDSEPE